MGVELSKLMMRQYKDGVYRMSRVTVAKHVAQLEEENARLRTYALFMESGRESAGVQRYRVALGLEDMAAWIVPDKHRALLTEKPE